MRDEGMGDMNWPSRRFSVLTFLILCVLESEERIQKLIFFTMDEQALIDSDLGGFASIDLIGKVRLNFIKRLQYQKVAEF